MKSKFKYPAYLLATGAILILGISVFIFIEDISKRSGFVLPFVHISPFVFAWIFIFFGELRTKTVTVIVKDDQITIRRFAGAGIARTYAINDISGFKTSVLISKGKEYEYLYLMNGNRKIAKLSEFYHSNYKELKRCFVANGIKNIGFESFSTRQEFRDIFSR